MYKRQDEDHPGSVKFYVEALEKETNHPMFTITPLDLEDTGRELQELAEFDS